MLNKIIVKSIMGLSLVVFLFSCKKDSFTPIDVNTLNPDNTLSNTALDAWLKTTFLDEYNVNVIYHNHIYYHEADRNVGPPDTKFVQPMMTQVLNSYILPYRKIAGANFIKNNVPKEFVLYGTTSYDASKVAYAGTATGGIRINLFGLNSYTFTPSYITGRVGVIHHEFTHILNQIYPMPSDFEKITPAYNASWNTIPVDTSHKNGFVTSYANGSPTEDFAEMTRALLVQGQSWFDYWVKTSTAGASQLRQKETSVVNYFNNIGVDFRSLQREVQGYIKDTLKDPSVTFPYWLNVGLPYTGLMVNLDDGLYVANGQSSSFAAVYNQFRAGVLAYSSTAKYRMDYLLFMFSASNKMTLRMAFTATDGTQKGAQFLGDYDFSMAITPSTGVVKFAKVANGTGSTYNNGALFNTSFTSSIQNYLVNNSFIGDWFLKDKMPANMLTKIAGFYVQGDPNNYFYGLLTQ